MLQPSSFRRVNRHSYRYESTSGGEREIQRTMLELLNQLDGFDTRGDVKVIMATNRIESLDPALIRPGRIDRKIEFPLPDVKTKRHIFRYVPGPLPIHNIFQPDFCKDFTLLECPLVKMLIWKSLLWRKTISVGQISRQCVQKQGYLHCAKGECELQRWTLLLQEKRFDSIPICHHAILLITRLPQILYRKNEGTPEGLYL